MSKWARHAPDHIARAPPESPDANDTSRRLPGSFRARTVLHALAPQAGSESGCVSHFPRANLKSDKSQGQLFGHPLQTGPALARSIRTGSRARRVSESQLDDLR